MIGFPSKRVYLDWASAAPTLPQVQRVFDMITKLVGNPGSVHREGVQAKRVLEDARTRIARLAGTKSESIVFTSGATEGNNLSILGFLRARAADSSLNTLHVLYLESAHSSTRGPLKQLEKEGLHIEPIALQGARIDEQKFRKQIRPETVLIVLEAVCGETGTMFDTRAVRRVVNAASPNTHIALHVDASQLPLVGSFEHTHLGADMIVLDAQKVGGVRGCGALILPKQMDLVPLAYGGGQQKGIRPGTECPALAFAFAVALETAHAGRNAFIEKAAAYRASLLTTVSEIQHTVENGEQQAPHILNLSLLKRDTDYLVMLLDADGIAVSTKSACESDAEGSHAVHIFTNDAERAASTLRISWGPHTLPRELQRAAQSLIRNVRFIDTR